MSAINHALHDQQDDDDEPLLDKDFHHPYTPYDVQKQFMSAVYQCLVERKVGILESPTGTVRLDPATTANTPRIGSWLMLLDFHRASR